MRWHDKAVFYPWIVIFWCAHIFFRKKKRTEVERTDSFIVRKNISYIISFSVPCSVHSVDWQQLRLQFPIFQYCCLLVETVTSLEVWVHNTSGDGNTSQESSRLHLPNNKNSMFLISSRSSPGCFQKAFFFKTNFLWEHSVNIFLSA